jgi:hypothetical protein
MTSEADLKEIRTLLQKLNTKVDGLNELVEERLIGCEDPTKDDVEAIREYEAANKKGKLTLVPLSDLTKRDLALDKNILFFFKLKRKSNSINCLKLTNREFLKFSICWKRKVCQLELISRNFEGT